MRKTKIIATLGPATDSPEMIGRLIDGGLNIFRLNMSHATHDWTRRVVKDIRAAASARNLLIGILMDTQGPAIRTGDLRSPLNLKPGERFTFTVRGEKSEEVNSVDVNYADFINDISVGDVVLVDNGAIQMKVLVKRGNKVECEVLTDGKLGSRRHINLPGVKVSLPPMTEKDIADVKLGLELQVDYIALSFVRAAKDIRELKKLISKSKDHHPLVIAKIEDQEAVRNLDSIVRTADGVMVARGDLGIEVPFEELPIIQRRIVKTCLHIGRPVIVATHMLESMIQSPMPTRAEVTDVANAVYEQADAIMLSGETTVGKYPLKCVETFDRIAQRIERSGGANYWEHAELTDPREKIAKSAVVMANELRATAIVSLIRSGSMTRYISWLRPRHSTIYAFGPSQDVAEELTLHWGVVPFVAKFDERDLDKNIENALKTLIERKCLRKGSTVVVVSSILSGDKVVDAVQMREI
ncbi:pyruvate kinase [Pedosphaera parvula]|uniref:Pyruvate kinase n=1 Tax=Pedosphaera parvula (strain Ellin514) TaxID=320771 RepID=B9XHI9_PEDPL|nr:pyruvate kinase [Pedosphaera parvula]EEF60824.1 pyruvate kinase [Pedosphaera parvula Ellin514]